MLRGLVNVASDDDFWLVVAFMVAALPPTGPYPTLAIDGEQGSAKSTQSRLIRQLIDPNKVALSAKPKDEADLIIAAQNGYVVALDNLSSIDAALSNSLCRLVTGTGLRRRKLYTDDEECLIAACRPVILNGIPALAVRPDLAERSISITLPAIPEERRRTEAEYWHAVKETAPVILGALLSGVVLALRDYTEVEGSLVSKPAWRISPAGRRLRRRRSDGRARIFLPPTQRTGQQRSRRRSKLIRLQLLFVRWPTRAGGPAPPSPS